MIFQSYITTSAAGYPMNFFVTNFMNKMLVRKLIQSALHQYESQNARMGELHGPNKGKNKFQSTYKGVRKNSKCAFSQKKKSN